MQEDTVTMTVQVPVALKDAFMARVHEDKKPASQIILDLMQAYARPVHIDEQERTVRARHVKEALASVHLEGGEISDFAYQLGQMYVDGKITMEAWGQMLRLYHSVQE